VLIWQKLLVTMFIWTIVSILISLSAGLEVFVTLEIIGLLVVREFTDGLLPREMKDRFDFFIYAGLVVFVIIVIRRVWLALS
jgi:hypothetical protein